MMWVWLGKAASATTMLRLLSLLFLAGCSSQTCQLSIATDVPIRLEHNRVLVTGKLNGTDATLLVDTGSHISIIATATANAMKLRHNNASVRPLSGIGGKVSNADVAADLTLDTLVGHLYFAAADLPGVDGLIGGDILANYDVEFDFPQHRMRLWEAPGCGVANLPSGYWKTVKLTRQGRNGLQLTAEVDGHPLTAVLDTGSSETVMTNETALHLGVPPAKLASDPTVPGLGVDGNPVTMHRHRFDSLTVQGDRMASPLIGVGDINVYPIEMVLGMDYLHTRRVWISYRTDEMFVRTAAN